MLFTMALRQLWRSGLRTWLNVLVLALTLILIIFMQGFNQGILYQASRAMINSEIAGGQYWHPEYTPYDPLTLQDAHSPLDATIQQACIDGVLTPILIRQASIYPEGRLVPALVKGIDPDQTILDLPTSVLKGHSNSIPALIGSRMAAKTALTVGDLLTIRWRDAHGTFDARDVEIVHIMHSDAPGVDHGQVWLPLDTLQALTDLSAEATLLIARNGAHLSELPGWTFKSQNRLLSDLHSLVRTRNIASSIFYAILLFLALIAIFDTQILALFKRRKEIGTFISLGMTRKKVIALFTIEGAMHGLLAVVLAIFLGTPVLVYFARNGFPIPQMSQDMGLAIGAILYPEYSAQLIVGTTTLVLLVVTLVSYLPVRRIALMNPTDALRGRM